jgi:hypothetical protein
MTAPAGLPAPWVLRVFHGLASLRLAVVVMLALAVACIAATFYESRYGTAAAQRGFYQTGWFTFLLVLLGTNVFLSMAKRFPWRIHHAGFVLAHVGILAILAGSLISLRAGLDGQMALYEGETSDQVSLADHALHVTLPGGAHTHLPVSVEDRLTIPGSDLAVVVEERQSHVEVGDVLEEDAPGGGPALDVVLTGPGVDTEGWLLAADPRRNRLDFGPVAVVFHEDADAHGEAAELAVAGGVAQVGYGPAHRPLPFEVTLLDFSSETYPGSSMAAAYQSRVRIEDPEQGRFERLISMNRPLHHRGYVFFQSSFVEGEPMMSILSVARAPGLPVVYAGTALLTLGVAWMFYVKPWLARRRAARAMAARSVGTPVPRPAV